MFLWWIVLCTYLAVHFLLYIAILRHSGAFRSEHRVLLYHVASAVIVTTGALVAYALGIGLDFAQLCGIISAHGIYSLSFLEIWALSEGGFSLRILTEIADRDHVTAAELERRFLSLSARKKDERLASLVRLGLLDKIGDRLHTTRRGIFAARVIATLARFGGSGGV
jgi:hypothetical protein